MNKIDLKKQLKHLYKSSSKKATIVDVPEMNFLMVDGAGDPNTSVEFKEAVEALYGVSYALKFMVKRGETALDYGVLPLEGLWWADDMAAFSIDNIDKKDEWKWIVMIMQPEYVTPGLLDEALEQVRKKKNPPALSRLRFEGFREGISAQILHVGPYADEAPTIAGLHEFIKEQGYALRGMHHEIYLSDPRRAAPEKLKTIIRQPIK